jgi:hypothetical protein
MMRVGLVGCVKQKGTAAAPARDLYTSTLFVGRRAYVERSCDCWFVLSAEHGLVRPETMVDPYDVTLSTARRQVRRDWSGRVLEQIDRALGDVQGAEFEIHAGAAYRDFGLVDGLQRRGANLAVPAEGLRQGEQLAFYRKFR